MPSWMNALSSNLKLVAAGAVAVLVAGTGAATTVTLAGSETGVPETVVASASPTPSASPVSDTATVGIAPDDDADEASEAAEASPSATATVGIRPTDTHGYCVSTAVHAATAAPEGGNLGAAKSAAAHSCPKANQKAKTHAPKPAKTHPAKPAKADKQRGKPAGAGPAADRPRGKSGH